VETAVKLRKDGHKVIIVSSGAIGVGLRRMDVEKRPKHLSKLQVCFPLVVRINMSLTKHGRHSQPLANAG
jgi:glutamate 5-kinase